MAHDRKIHIHELAPDPCIACGDTPSADNDFISDTGQWNSEARNCSPGAIVSPDYVLTGRSDPRTSALKEERLPNPKRTRDLR
jgi:hypothetical protein